MVTNSSFTDNTAAGYGGALYVRAGMTIRADGDTAAFSGNTANGESNAAYVMAGQTLTLETLNGGNIVSDDGFTGSEDGWTLVLSGDDNGEITLNGEIKNAEIVSGIAKGNGLTGIADTAVTNIAGGNLIGNGTNSLAMNGGLVNIQSLGFERLQLKNLALNGGKLDIYNVNADLENVKMGEMSAEEVSGDLALVEVKSLDVLSDGEAETTHVMFADNNILAGQVASQIAESAGPVYNYDVEYLPENGEFTFTRRERKDKFNPEVLESGMAVVASIGVLNDEIYSRVLADADRTAFRKGAAEAGGASKHTATAWRRFIRHTGHMQTARPSLPPERLNRMPGIWEPGRISIKAAPFGELPRMPDMPAKKPMILTRTASLTPGSAVSAPNSDIIASWAMGGRCSRTSMPHTLMPMPKIIRPAKMRKSRLTDCQCTSWRRG